MTTKGRPFLACRISVFRGQGHSMPIIISDVWGPAKVTSIGGWNYYISFIDDTKHYDTILFLVKKSNSTECIKGHVTKLKQKFGKRRDI